MIVDHLPLGDVKAEAEFVVEFHVVLERVRAVGDVAS